MNEKLLKIVKANAFEPATDHWTVENIRRELAFKYGGLPDLNRDLHICKSYSNNTALGHIFFSLNGSPAKGSAIWSPDHHTLTLVDAWGHVFRSVSDVGIKGINKIPDECCVDGDGNIKKVDKTRDKQIEPYSSMATQWESLSSYKQEIDNILMDETFEYIYLYQNETDNYFTNCITIREHKDGKYGYLHYSMGNWKLREGVSKKIFDILNKYRDKVRDEYVAWWYSEWGFDTFCLEIDALDKTKEELDNIILDMDSYIHDLEIVEGDKAKKNANE